MPKKLTKKAPSKSKAPKTPKTPLADQLLRATGYTLEELNAGILKRAPGALAAAQKHQPLLQAVLLEHAATHGGMAEMLKAASGAALASALRTMLFTAPADVKVRPVFKNFGEPLFEEVCARLERGL